MSMEVVSVGYSDFFFVVGIMSYEYEDTNCFVLLVIALGASSRGAFELRGV
jgi:hypothetical protein